MRGRGLWRWVALWGAITGGACGGDGGGAGDEDAGVARDGDGGGPDGDADEADASAPDETAELFEPDRLLEIEIDLAPADWEILRHEHNDFRTFVDACPGVRPDSPYGEFSATVRIDGEVVENVAVRKKGFVGSVTPVRPSLKLQFDELVTDRTFHGLTHMTLNNNRQDPSQANTCLAYRVFREAGVVAPRCNHARVTVNGQDLGVYSHVESIRRPFLERAFGDGSGNLYEGAIADFRPVWVDQYEDKDGNDGDRRDLGALVDALEPDGPGLEDRLEPILDVDAFLTFWAAEVLVGHWDGYTSNQNNHYVYRDPSSGQLRFIPWGPDSSFGPQNPFLDGAPPPSVWAVALLPRRLYQNPGTHARYQERLRELIDQVWDEDALLAEVDRIHDLLAAHVTVSTESFEAELGRVRDFIRAQRATLEADLDEDPSWTLPPRESPCLHQIGTASGTFSSPFGPFPATNPFGNGTGTLRMTVGGVEQEFAQIGTSAGPFGEPNDPSVAVALFGLRRDLTFLAPVISIDPDLFATGVFDVDVYSLAGFLIEGEGSTFTQKAFGLGRLTVDEATTTEGELVSGSFDLDLFWF